MSDESVLVGMSGGVDSSVAAMLLQRAGHRVEGLFMKNWDDDDGSRYCTALEDLLDAQRVCDHLGIPLHSVSFSREYREQVFAQFLSEYRSGRTPNPDVLCNREIKFRAFAEHATTLGAKRIATGHYARLLAPDREGGGLGTERKETLPGLLKGLDAGKDQSYFLYQVPASRLAGSLFPLGGMQKHQVRQLAARAGLHNHARKDSTGICFIGERRFADFLAHYLPAEPGEIRSLDGCLLGEHRGLPYHTIGQRQGLGIGGRRDSPEAPWYVVAKDMTANLLYVVQGNDHPALFSHGLTAGQLHWIGPAPETGSLTAKIRYRQPDQLCHFQPLAGGRCRVHFDQPQRAVTPGQSVVFYRGERCLGGGVIEAAEPVTRTQVSE